MSVAEVHRTSFEVAVRIVGDYLLEYLVSEPSSWSRYGRTLLLLGPTGIGKNGAIREALRNLIRAVVSLYREQYQKGGELLEGLERFGACITDGCRSLKFRIKALQSERVSRVVKDIVKAVNISNCERCEELYDEGILVYDSSLEPEAYKNKVVLVEHDIPSSDPQELLGLRDLEMGYSKHSPPDWAVALRSATFGVLVLNDINYRCPEAVRMALNSIAYERRVGDYRIGKPVVLTANVEEDVDVYLESLQVLLINRVEIIHVRAPRIETWMRYMKSVHKENWLNEVGHFLLYVSSYGIFDDGRYVDGVFVSVAEEDNLMVSSLKNFPTPRGWESVACIAKKYAETYKYIISTNPNKDRACDELERLYYRVLANLGSEELSLIVVSLVASKTLRNALLNGALTKAARRRIWEVNDAYNLIAGVLEFLENLEKEVPCPFIKRARRLLIATLIERPTRMALSILEKKVWRTKEMGRPMDLCEKLISLVDKGEPSVTFLSAIMRILESNREIVSEIRDRMLEEIKEKLSEGMEGRALACLVSEL